MYPISQEVVLFDNVTPVTVTSSTDATPIVVTATAHGLVTGKRVLVYGHSTNIAANGIFKVGVTTANTFQLLDEITGASVAGSGAGSGSGGICCVAPPVLSVASFRNVVFQVDTSGSTTSTLCAIGSLGNSPSKAIGPRYVYPNMGATPGQVNPWAFLNLVDLNSAASITGATGIVIAGTDINKQYEANINSLRFFTVIPISWSAGVITIRAIVVTNA